MKYRPEVDGLRTIALVPVVLFHAGLSIFSGGYIGVDVFFVISGYLITTILLGELEAGTYSVRKFYERRARRILPALTLVILASLPFAWFWMVPSQYKDFSQSLIAIAAFSSNILFFVESDYFAPAAELKPMLHTWSLAVEEQYYIFFPLLLAALWRLGKWQVAKVLVAITLVSFIACVAGAYYYPVANFYLVPFRAWELLAGSLCAFILTSQPYPTKTSFLGTAGLAMILAGVFLFTGYTPFPGLWALVPVIGSSLIILYGRQDPVIQAILASRPFVFIGLISYSGYLWHQPIFAFARLRSEEELRMPVMLGLALLSFVLAYLSWRFVEKPFRTKGSWVGRTQGRIFILAGLSCLLIIAAGAYGQLKRGVNGSHYTEVVFPAAGQAREASCLLSSTAAEDFAPECFTRNPRNVLVWGDSHAASLYVGIKNLAPPSTGVTQLTAEGCPPFVGFDGSSNRFCKGANEQVVKAIQSQSYDLIVLHSAWTHPAYPISADEAASDLRKTIQYIKQQSPRSRVVVVGPVPRWYISAEMTWFKLPEAERAQAASLDGSPVVYGNAIVLPTYDAELGAAAREEGTEYISPLALLCKPDFSQRYGQCVLSVDGRKEGLAAIDYGHLSAAGSNFLVKRMMPALGPIMQDVAVSDAGG